MSKGVGTSEELYLKHYDPGKSQLTNHKTRLVEIRTASYDHGMCEEYYLPTDEALEFHFRRGCWGHKVGLQADQPIIDWPNVVSHGWQISADNELVVVWDTPANLYKIEAICKLWSRGCGCCKSDCSRLNCSCRKKGYNCGPGCKCSHDNCTNQLSDKGPVGLQELLDKIIRDGGFVEI